MSTESNTVPVSIDLVLSEFTESYNSRARRLMNDYNWLQVKRNDSSVSDTLWNWLNDRLVLDTKFLNDSGCAVRCISDSLRLDEVSRLRLQVSRLKEQVALMRKQAASAGIDPDLIFWQATT